MTKLPSYPFLKILFGSIFLCFGSLCNGSDEESAPQNIPVESRATITHEEDGPGLTKKKGQPEEKSAPKDASNEKNQKDVSLVCYKSGVCLVKDRRAIKTHSGLNEITFQEIDPLVNMESINFRTPKKGKIRVANFVFHRKDWSRYNLFQRALNEEIFFQLAENGKIEKGILLSFSKENNNHYAVIKSDGKCVIVPLSSCIAIGENTMKHMEQNSLDLQFEVDEADDIDIEISYLTPSIHWKHVCLVDVFEKMDRVDIISQALIENNTDYDLENVDIVFDTSIPDLNHDGKSFYIESKSVLSYKRKLSVKKNSNSMCVLKSAKEIKPVMEHIMRIPFDVIYSSGSKETNIPVKNLLVIENMIALGIGADFHDSEVLLFSRMQGERNFLGKRMLSSVTKGEDFIFEIGNATGIIGSVRLTDTRRLSEKNVENWIRVLVKNDKTTDVTVSIIIDVDGLWHVSRENMEMQKSDKPLWRLTLKPNETKELHFRMITDNK
ncbi:MAG: DUF4139 domain-containing protein [Holosporaceae bacterium]|jgi:hypothetical protein|nr:DUF4139 domain-containing protein [Holosporaceae bacterium]